MNWKNITVIFVIVFYATALTTRAETKNPNCKDVIDAADKTIAAKNKALELKDIALQNCNDQNAATSIELEEEKSKNNSIFKNPFAMTLLGAILGGLIVYKIDRR